MCPVSRERELEEALKHSTYPNSIAMQDTPSDPIGSLLLINPLQFLYTDFRNYCHENYYVIILLFSD